ncbi:MAG: alginate export family protein [Oleiphilaceae bacterium]|nr:alginate export family protein [Oleiphilaceae bacterium]
MKSPHRIRTEHRRVGGPCLLVSAVLLGAPAQCLQAGETGNELLSALSGGTTSVDARYRYELVDQDNALEEARASTLRVRLGYRTGGFYGFDAFVEAEHITAIGPENYNSTLNNRSDRSVVADPVGTELNQAYLRYRGLADTELRYGRQRLALDNHRFIGTVGWRQNEQTFDGFTLVNRSLPDTTITAGYLYNANRIFSDESPMGNFPLRAPLLNVRYEGLGAGSLTGYSYLLDFTDNEALSTQTHGLRFKGNSPLTDQTRLLYTLEYAYQGDYEGNPDNLDLNYHRLELGLSGGGVTGTVGREGLEGDGQNAFQTPLATLHAMNGWTDQFLATPDNGLRDTYVSVGGKLAGTSLKAVYHDFSSDRDSIDYGTELGFVATYPVAQGTVLGFKAARYSADERGVDTDKLWLWAGYTF